MVNIVRVFLVEPTIVDAMAWKDWFNDQTITDAMNKGAFPNTAESQEEHFRRIMGSKTDVQFKVGVDCKKGVGPYEYTADRVGLIGIHKIDWIHRRGDVSVVIGDEEFWGKGVATEAIRLVVCHGFLKMNLRKLTAGMWDTNVGSRRAFEKNGFVLEGTLQENFHHRGSYVAELRYGLLRSGWEKIQK